MPQLNTSTDKLSISKVCNIKVKKLHVSRASPVKGNRKYHSPPGTLNRKDSKQSDSHGKVSPSPILHSKENEVFKPILKNSKSREVLVDSRFEIRNWKNGLNKDIKQFFENLDTSTTKSNKRNSPSKIHNEPDPDPELIETEFIETMKIRTIDG